MDFRGERLVCDSLSRFLTTFVLQEITLGSRVCLCDEGLTARFESERDSTIPVWIKGPYVNSSEHHYCLWGHVLVAHPWEDCFYFGANGREGIDFLTENQGPVKMISLTVGGPWRLDIRSDGSAQLRFLEEQVDEFADAPPRTFDFRGLVDLLSAAVSDQGHYERNAIVLFHRMGQSGLVWGKNLLDRNLATAIFQEALKKATKPNKALQRLFTSEWPI